MCPRFIRMVKENGLVCMTYGVLNNDPKNVRVSAILLFYPKAITDCVAVARERGD